MRFSEFRYRMDMLALYVDAIVCGMDFFSILEGALHAFYRADWKRAYRKRGALGLLIEFVSTFMGHNEVMFKMNRFDLNRSKAGIDVERLLWSYRIPVWYRHIESGQSEGLPADTLAFCVPKRHAKWAEYILLRAGVPLVGKQYDSRNATRAARYPVRAVPQSNRPNAKRRKW